MQRPEVRIIQPQQNSEPQEVSISSAEAYALMAKYGIPQEIPQQISPIQDPNRDLTFDEMVAMEESRLRLERQRIEMERMREMNKPTPYSFDRKNINYYDTKYKSLDDTNFGVEIKIVSDMPIDNGRKF